MLNILQTNFNEVQFITLLFSTFFIHQKWNMNYYIKKLLRRKLTKSITLIDCYPCFSFWLTLIITFNPIVAIAVYMAAVIIDRKNV